MTAGEERTVYYPVPYCSPPNLTLEVDNGFVQVTLLDQKPDQFRFVSRGLAVNNKVDVCWKAKGVRAGGPPPPVPPPPEPPSPTQPPQLPVPVEKVKS